MDPRVTSLLRDHPWFADQLEKDMVETDCCRRCLHVFSHESEDEAALCCEGCGTNYACTICVDTGELPPIKICTLCGETYGCSYPGCPGASMPVHKPCMETVDVDAEETDLVAGVEVLKENVGVLEDDIKNSRHRFLALKAECAECEEKIRHLRMKDRAANETLRKAVRSLEAFGVWKAAGCPKIAS